MKPLFSKHYLNKFFICLSWFFFLNFSAVAQNSPTQNAQLKNSQNPLPSIGQDKIAISEEGEGVTVEKADPSRFAGIAMLQILNKTTAKTGLLDLKVGEKMNFGNLKLIAHKCWQAPLEKKPESKILLEVFETKIESDKVFEKRIFYGWLFASSPSISGLEHPIYDLTALGCKNK